MPLAPDAPSLVSLRVGDAPAAWARAGFVVDDGGCVHVGGITIELVGDGGGRGLLAWTFRNVADPEALIGDGLPTHVTGDDAPGPPTPEHPNTAVAVDHVVVATPDTGRTTAAFAAAGLAPRRLRPFTLDDKPMVQAFYVAGNAVIEQVGPREDRLGPDRDDPTSFYGLGVTVGDLDAAAELLDDRVSPVRPAVQPGRRIATLRHARMGVTVPTVLLSPRPPRATEGSEVS